MAEPLGCFVLVLHGHIPYVLGHGTWPHGAQMLYEAAADTYIPLLWTLEELAYEGISANLVISFSPVTMEQLADERFQKWFEGYLNDKIHWASENEGQFGSWGEGHLEYLARRWRQRYEAVRDSFCNRYNRDILGQYRQMQDDGHIEVMTSAATHGYLPLLHEDASVNLQVCQAVQTYQKHFGRWPRAFWLPEGAYRPRCQWAPPPEVAGTKQPYARRGIEEFLAENGLDYFVVDTHLLGGGGPEPVDIDWEHTVGKLWGRIRKVRQPQPYSGDKSPYLPYFVGHAYEDHPPVAVLVRDPQTGLKVWSAEHGYPGDFNYLEFHKKHIPGDLRYWRITDANDNLGSKQLYQPDWADGQVRAHAGNFLWTVKETLRAGPRPDGRLPVLCAPFDAELFGHWWFEGPRFLAHALRWMHQDPEIEVLTGSEYLARYSPQTAITLPEGSWGAGGGHWVWLNEDTTWSWQRIYDAELDLRALVQNHGAGHDETMGSLIKQAMRELLLLQASDWQFLITTWSARDYAEVRIQSHHTDFKRVVALARKYARGEWISEQEWAFFGGLCQRDNVFSDIKPEWYAV